MFKTLTLGAALAALFFLFQSPVKADHFLDKFLDVPVCSTEIYKGATEGIINVAKFEGEQRAESVRSIITTMVGEGQFPFKWSRVDFFKTADADNQSLMIVFAKNPQTGQDCAAYMNSMLTLDQVSEIVTQMKLGEI